MIKMDAKTIVENMMELTFYMHEMGGAENIETLILRREFYNGLIKEDLVSDGDKEMFGVPFIVTDAKDADIWGIMSK